MKVHGLSLHVTLYREVLYYKLLEKETKEETEIHSEI